MWCIPPKRDAAFVCAMENVLEVYRRPYDPRRPVVGMDEQPRQLIAETRTPAALYEAFEPAEARRIAEKLELVYTPKHGSWLNVAEIELSVLSRQCLNRRMPERSRIADEATAWERRRNRTACTTDWRFTTADARIKLKHLYPKTQS